jgi:hypothetical protein
LAYLPAKFHTRHSRHLPVCQEKGGLVTHDQVQGCLAVATSEDGETGACKTALEHHENVDIIIGNDNGYVTHE